MSDKSAPVDEELDMILVDMAEACINGNIRATADAVGKAHARLFAAIAAEREACVKVANKIIAEPVRRDGKPAKELRIRDAIRARK